MMSLVIGALECGGTTPLWIGDHLPHPKRRRAAALHMNPILAIGLILPQKTIVGFDRISARALK
jgi:hypothetical protein